MALKLNGKDERLKRADFRALASTAGLLRGDADAAIDDVVHRLKAAADRLTLPELPSYGPDGKEMTEKMLALCRARADSFA